MSRYARIESLSFDGTELPLPLSVRVSQQTDTSAAAGDNDAFATSVQLSVPTITVEVRIRGTATAETMSLGDAGTLAFTVAPAGADAPARAVTINGAVLTAVDIVYEQLAMAVAVLRFTAEAEDGGASPFSAGDTP